MRIKATIALLLAAATLGSAQAPKPTSIKMAAGEVVQGSIAGQVAFDVGFGTGGGIVAGKDIESIDEKGLHIRAGASVVQTILPLLNRYTMMKKPPYALILQNTLAKKPQQPGMVEFSFEAPCKLFDDATCENVTIAVSLVASTTKDSSPLVIDRVLGELRVQGEVGTIVPALAVTGSGGKATRVDVTRIVAFEKAGK